MRCSRQELRRLGCRSFLPGYHRGALLPRRDIHALDILHSPWLVPLSFPEVPGITLLIKVFRGCCPHCAPILRSDPRDRSIRTDRSRSLRRHGRTEGHCGMAMVSNYRTSSSCRRLANETHRLFIVEGAVTGVVALFGFVFLP